MSPFTNANLIGSRAHCYGQDDAGYYSDHPNTVLKAQFEAEKMGKAEIRIAGLGFYDFQINGQPGSRTVLNGPWTNFAKTVLYDTFDISDLIRPGSNEIRIELGNGYYNPSPLRFFGKYNLRENLAEIGEPAVTASIVLDGKEICTTGPHWKAGKGNLLFNNLYLGERADLRQEDRDFEPVVLYDKVCRFEPNEMPPIRRIKEVQPKSIQETEEGILVDFGEMISGFIEISLEGTDGQTMNMLFAENADGSKLNLLCNTNGSVGETMPDGRKVDGGPGAPEYAYEQDTVILKEGMNSFTNRFTYHSFRYCLIKGIQTSQIYSISAWYVHTDVKQTGFVQTDNPAFNELYAAALRTKLNNFHSSFEDCARERLGYGGDMVALADSNLYTFDLKNTYRKILKDFINDQTQAGGFPETAPFMGIGSKGTAYGEGPLLWQYAVPYLAMKLIQFYDDTDFVQEVYPAIQKNLDYLLTLDFEDLSKHCLGDHGSVLIAGQFYKPTPDKDFAGWVTILLFLETFIRISGALGRDTSAYEQKHDLLKQEIIERFRNEDGSFADGTQTSYGFAYAGGLEQPEKLASALVQLIAREDGVFTAGIFGTKFNYDLLHECGYDEVIAQWLTREGTISYSAMLKTGNKAFAELFTGDHYSYNHAMFTSFVQWFYEGIGGIQVASNARGADSLILHGQFPSQIHQADVSFETIRGHVCSSWKREGEKIRWKVQIPEGVSVTEKPLPENCSLEICIERSSE
ncbi:MAG: family 78 glycoside hydrolase catalytic domain [Ileibacterium sp.]|nr:family 78 glycoside hydrolase catalytic domain [Ileibacterium sp.]